MQASDDLAAHAALRSVDDLMDVNALIELMTHGFPMVTPERWPHLPLF